jgi:hypothetical protein
MDSILIILQLLERHREQNTEKNLLYIYHVEAFASVLGNKL